MDELKVKTDFLAKILKELKNRKVDEVSFEFLIGSCFPTVMDNIKNEMRRQHAMGYAEGLRGSTSTSDVEVRPIDESEGIQETMQLQ